jgi:hypothetical protein
MAYVSNPTGGGIDLMIGDREVAVRDPDLVMRLLKAAGK